MRALGFIVISLSACATLSTDAADPTSSPDAQVSETHQLAPGDEPVPGLPGIAISHRNDPAYCGGVAAIAVRTGANIANEDEGFADLLLFRSPTGLDFSEPSRQASMDRFANWFEAWSTRNNAVREHYTRRFTDGSTSAERIVAMARVAQALRNAAQTLAGMEIPVDVRTGEYADEKMAAFCQKASETASTMHAAADQAASECARAAKAVAPGWWNQVCR